MEFKIVISDSESGKSYQRDVKDDVARKFKNLGIGDELDGSAIGLDGYKLKITGGSDKSGFPMRKGIHGSRRPMVLLSKSVGYHPQRDERRRKRIRGERIDDDIVQINTKIIVKGKKSVEELFGIEVKAEEKPAEKTEKEKEIPNKKEAEVKEEKPKEKAEKAKAKAEKQKT